MVKKSIIFNSSKLKIKSKSILGAPKVPTIIKFLVLNGIIKKEKHAVTFVFIGIFLLISSSVFLFTKSITINPAIINPTILLHNK